MLGLVDEEADAEKDPLIDTIKRGVLAIQREEYEKAEKFLHKALRMAQELDNENGVTYVVDLLANVSYKQGDFTKAEQLFREVMQRLLSRGTPQDDPSLVEISLKLCGVYSAWGQDDKAEMGYRFCCDAMEKKVKAVEDATPDENHLALWGMSHDWFAQFLLSRSRYKEALQQFQTAYQSCCQLYGERHSQSLVLLNSLGTVACLNGDHEEAGLHVRKAIQLARETDSEHLPSFLINLGMLNIQQVRGKLNVDKDISIFSYANI